MLRMEIENILMSDCRPGYPERTVSTREVQERIAEWQQAGIKSVICLLDDTQLGYYGSKPGLLEQYRAAGLVVVSIPIRDHQQPPIPKSNYRSILQSFDELPKPVLIHCSAGIDRTGAAVDAIVAKYNSGG